MSVSKKVIRTSVIPGKANPQQLSQQLSQLGLDVNKVVNVINEKTKILASYGLKNVSVELEVDLDTKEIDIKLELPAISELILRAIGREEGSHKSINEIIGDLDLEKLAEITYIKWDELKCRNFKAALKQVVSTCRSVGVTINGKDPREVIKEIDNGLHSDIISKYEEKLRSEGRL
ncbi:MAG: 50S ribosomal protein L11 [Thermoprotei archaeon ex4572_64]|nr:MAG: 50S ribosomal protein L11 [Thermoprotei archaeon ex4572_64]